MQNAADAAALAAVRDKEDLSQKQIAKLVKDYFGANGGEAEVKRSTRVWGRETTRDVIVNAWVRADTMFVHYLTGSKTDFIHVQARARKGETKVKGVEIALLMDNTQSMSFGTTWSSAARALEKTLEEIEAETQAGRLYTTYIRFADRINIGKHRTHWLAKTDSLDDWEGCVEPLENAQPGYPFYLDMGNPTGSFIPTVPKYWGGVFDMKGKRACPDPIIGPTKNISEIRKEMAGNKPLSGATGRFDSALMWGWRAVSKQWKGKWGVSGQYPSDDGEVHKKVVLFTDAHSNINEYEMEKKKGEFGWNNLSVNVLNHIVKVCDRIKADGVEIFVFHVIGNTHAEPYFRDCAGDDNYVQIRSAKDLQVGLDILADLGTEEEPRLVR